MQIYCFRVAAFDALLHISLLSFEFIINSVYIGNIVFMLFSLTPNRTKMQLRKYFLNAIAVIFNTWIFNFLFKQSISDLHTGTKIIKNSLLKKLSISSKGFGIEVDLSGQIAKKGIYIYEFGISYYERSFEEGKKITFLDGLMTYYYLFKSRFLQNDIYTSSSLIFSFITMGLMGYSFIGQGNRIFNVFLFDLGGVW